MYVYFAPIIPAVCVAGPFWLPLTAGMRCLLALLARISVF